MTTNKAKLLHDITEDLVKHGDMERHPRISYDEECPDAGWVKMDEFNYHPDDAWAIMTDWAMKWWQSLTPLNSLCVSDDPKRKDSDWLWSANWFKDIDPKTDPHGCCSMYMLDEAPTILEAIHAAVMQGVKNG